MKVRFVIILPIFFISTLLSAAAQKQDSVWHFYRGVSVTANRYEKDVFETHLPVRMVHEDQIWQKGMSNMSTMVEDQAGVDVVNSGPWSEKVVVRGLVGHNLLLVDGLRLDVLRGYGSHAPLIDVEQDQSLCLILHRSKGAFGIRYQAPESQYWIEMSSVFVADQDCTTENELHTPGYGLLNFSKGFNLSTILPIKTPIHLIVNGRNILDRSYRDHLSTVTWWDAAGRDIAVGLKV